ncbi:MAG TPA: Crp/Fnr family transcriptional regulator [Chitinophagaceae bacterium]|nr:Crp/Fnr family transcriptional regulator [Chitinophagaceae bacterium]
MVEPLYQYLYHHTNLSRERFDAMRPYLEIRHFGKNVTLAETGEVDNYVNFVTEGLVRKFFYRGSEEVITQLAKEFELVCSSVSFLSGQPSTYIVETIEPTTTISISRENMGRIYAIGTDMERMGRLVITEWLLQKEYWVNDRTTLNPRARFIKFMDENADLIKRVPQKFLASYLNMKPETFSRYKHLLSTPL